ncbi:MAG: hypothetical protein LBJ92_01215 [Holosporales bacterium]|nr:hypothetical protein [Holosporales bacterium]
MLTISIGFGAQDPDPDEPSSDSTQYFEDQLSDSAQERKKEEESTELVTKPTKPDYPEWYNPDICLHFYSATILYQMARQIYTNQTRYDQLPFYKHLTFTGDIVIDGDGQQFTKSQVLYMLLQAGIHKVIRLGRTITSIKYGLDTRYVRKAEGIPQQAYEEFTKIILTAYGEWIVMPWVQELEKFTGKTLEEIQLDLRVKAEERRVPSPRYVRRQKPQDHQPHCDEGQDYPQPQKYPTLQIPSTPEEMSQQVRKDLFPPVAIARVTAPDGRYEFTIIYSKDKDNPKLIKRTITQIDSITSMLLESLIEDGTQHLPKKGVAFPEVFEFPSPRGDWETPMLFSHAVIGGQDIVSLPDLRPLGHPWLLGWKIDPLSSSPDPKTVYHTSRRSRYPQFVELVVQSPVGPLLPLLQKHLSILDPISEFTPICITVVTTENKSRRNFSAPALISETTDDRILPVEYPDGTVINFTLHVTYVTAQFG